MTFSGTGCNPWLRLGPARTGERPLRVAAHAGRFSRDFQHRKRLSANSLADLFRQLYEHAGIVGASFHSGRRWFITELARAGIPRGSSRVAKWRMPELLTDCGRQTLEEHPTCPASWGTGDCAGKSSSEAGRYGCGTGWVLGAGFFLGSSRKRGKAAARWARMQESPCFQGL